MNAHDLVIPGHRKPQSWIIEGWRRYECSDPPNFNRDGWVRIVRQTRFNHLAEEAVESCAAQFPKVEYWTATAGVSGKPGRPIFTILEGDAS